MVAHKDKKKVMHKTNHNSDSDKKSSSKKKKTEHKKNHRKTTQHLSHDVDTHHKSHSSHNQKNKKHPLFKKLLKIEHEIPLGIRVLCVYLFLLGLFYAFITLTFKKAMILGIMFTGPLALLFNSGTIILLLFLILGFTKKKKAYYYIGLGFFVLIIINTLISIFSLRMNTIGSLRNYTNVAFVLTLLLNVITIIFIIKKKYYFLHPKPERHIRKEDKVFVLSLVFIWILLLLSTIYFGDRYYQETFSQVDQLIFDLKDRGVIESLGYCNNFENRDLCLLVAAIINEEDVNTKLLCDKIDLSIFKNDCLNYVGDETLIGLSGEVVLDKE